MRAVHIQNHPSGSFEIMFLENAVVKHSVVSVNIHYREIVLWLTESE